MGEQEPFRDQFQIIYGSHWHDENSPAAEVRTEQTSKTGKTDNKAHRSTCENKADRIGIQP